MRNLGLALVVTGALVAPAAAQVRRLPQGVPPGQLPPAGQCRVWYEGVPPGRQPRATNCREAERIAARDPRARVIYGSGRAIPRTIPRRIPSGASGTYPGVGQYANVAFDRGYEDGYEKGREDARDNDQYDPGRHGRFRSADHGYERRYGSKAEYQRVYREGFRRGYDEGYRDNDRGVRTSRNGRWPDIRLPWPF
jgi:hypothetical protein